MAGKVPPVGSIRQSQIITACGPGAMVDLPEHSVLIGGLNQWFGEKRPVHEPRLAATASAALGLDKVVPLYAPPPLDESPAASAAGVNAFIFPAWFVAQVSGTFYQPPDSNRRYRTRPMVHYRGLIKGRYVAADRKKWGVVPVRFVQGCPNGHLSDIDWVRFAHPDTPPCAGREIWIDEGGTGGDLADIFIRCNSCGQRRRLANAKLKDGKVLGWCDGHRPWLGPASKEPCVSHKGEGAERNLLLARSASNTWFGQNLTVISIPDPGEKLRAAVDKVYEHHLQWVDDADDLARERKKKPPVAEALAGFEDSAILEEISRRKSGAKPVDLPIKVAEVTTLRAVGPLAAGTSEEADFRAELLAVPALPPEADGLVERVVLVHRLREVSTQIGFTRFEPVMANLDGELDLDVRRAAIDLEVTWLPAVENRGEGFFLGFSAESVAAWMARPAVKVRVQRLAEGFAAWQKTHSQGSLPFPGGPYYMLHTLSHLLLTAISLECGYPSTSIRERVYAGTAGYGILLYTGSPGSEGTLGGLVKAGRDIGRHLLTALELGRLCSNDPVCAHHAPNDVHEERFLHGAACHGCLLVGETSCERRNEALDRALVVQTVDAADTAFFPISTGK